MSQRNIFIISVIAGFLFWGIFAWYNIEPWDSPYGLQTVGLLGLVLGFIGKENPWLWPLGIYLGETLFGLGSFIFSSGGGANMFIPLGMIFLIPFTVPAFIGSFVGSGIRKVIKPFYD